MTVWLCCRACTTGYQSEATAERVAAVMNTVRACGGSEHVVIEATTAHAAHEAYLAAFAVVPRLPERRDLDG